MKVSAILVVIMAMTMMAAACGSSSTAKQQDTVKAFCQSQCDREQRCQTGSTTADVCVTNCTSSGPQEGIFKPGVLSYLATCDANLACGASDDGCLWQALVAQDPNWQQNPDYLACLATHATCATASSSFGDDLCVSLILCTSATVATVKGCLAQDCATIATCLDPVLGS